MNDESSVFENTETAPRSPCDTPETVDASTGDACDSPTRKALFGEAEAAVGIPTDTGADPDTDCEDADSKAQESELEQLRGELKQLREELHQRDLRAQREERISREYTEFLELYPETPIASLPQEVWQEVEKGTPLAAAYALAERKRSLRVGRAADSNTSNRTRSAGAVRNAESIEFSPAEVRAMSSQEVRANLSKIMRSMQKWH